MAAQQQSRLWPNETFGRAVWLFIGALGANVLNCRISVVISAMMPIAGHAGAGGRREP